MADSAAELNVPAKHDASTEHDTQDELPLVLVKDDWARILKKSRRTIDRLYRSGQLPAPLTDGDPRWSRGQARAWLDGGRYRRRRA